MSIIKLLDGTLVSAESILRDPQSWSPAFVSAAKMAIEMDAIRARSGAAPKVTTVGIADQGHAQGHAQEAHHA